MLRRHHREAKDGIGSPLRDKGSIPEEHFWRRWNSGKWSDSGRFEHLNEEERWVSERVESGIKCLAWVVLGVTLLVAVTAYLTKHLRKGGFVVASCLSVWSILAGRAAGAVVAAGWGIWSPWIHTQEAESNECWCSTCFLFPFLFSPGAHWMALPTLRVGLHTSYTSPETLSSRSVSPRRFWIQPGWQD